MRVALNTRILLAPRTGIGRYVTELVAALASESDIDLHLFNGIQWGRSLPSASLPGYTRLAAAVRRWIPGAYRWRRWLEQPRFERGADRREIDLYHDPSLWPLDFKGPMVMTLHDLTHLRYPQTQPAGRLAEIERHVGRGVVAARRILVDSAFIGQEVTEYFGLPSGRIVVAPLGCSADFHPRDEVDVRATLSEVGLRHRGFFLCVATREPRKNLGMALCAHRSLPDRWRAHYPLLLVGMMGWGENRRDTSLRTDLAAGFVRMPGYLDQIRLADLVASATALLYPSLYEGFGLPVLEAMTSGTPVIVSNRASLPEIAGAAGFVVDAEDVEGWASAMQQLTEDENEWIVRRLAGLQQAGCFSWERCAAITAQTYRAALAS